MAAFFTASSTQRLLNSAHPLPAALTPATIAMWVKPTTSGAAKRFWSVADPSSSTDFAELNISAAGAFGGAAKTSTWAVSGTAVVGSWHFVLVRFISSTSRWLQVLFPDGSVTSAQNAGSNTLTAATSMALGIRISSGLNNPFDGHIAEFWYTKANPYGITGALPNPLFRILAYEGPFGVPEIAKDLQEYRSLRVHPIRGHGEDQIIGNGVKSSQAQWSNVNGVVRSQHPPLPYWYENPYQRKTVLVV